MKINPFTTLLLIVDVQNDFCPGGTLAVNNGNEVALPLNLISGALAEKGGKVAATQDWHPAGHISFASSYKNEKPGNSINTPIVKGQVLWPDHCVQGSKGADFHAGLDLNPVSIIIRKGVQTGMDSYSSFFENDRKTPTGLEGILRCLGTETVIIGGIATDYCVFFSAMDCRALGFKTIIASDAVRAVDYPKGSAEKAIEEMKNAGIEFFTSQELLNIIN